MSLYQQKEIDYFTNIRIDLVQLIPQSAENKILELGAGGGDTLVWIKENGLAKETVGIELNKLEGSNQSHPAIDRFIFTNIEQDEIDLPLSYFDVLICGDVLEHLIDPWKALPKVMRHVRRGGVVIVSCPNIRNYHTLIDVFFKGSFRYQPHGVFDKTHLRFFCRKDIVKMMTDTGAKIESVVPSFKLVNLPAVKRMNTVTLGIFEEFLAVQYVVVARM